MRSSIWKRRVTRTSLYHEKPGWQRLCHLRPAIHCPPCGISRKTSCGNRSGRWKSGVVPAEIHRCEKPLFRRADDERDIRPRLRAEIEPRLEQVQRDGHRRHPCAVSRHVREGRDFRHRDVALLGPDAGSRELAGPPRAVGREVEFEVAPARRVRDEQLRDVVFPQLRLEPAGPRLRVQIRRCSVVRDEPQTSVVQPPARTRRRAPPARHASPSRSLTAARPVRPIAAGAGW